jgi:NTP pyrophosphatase (non-canonical NTP hydrolase)
MNENIQTNNEPTIQEKRKLISDEYFELLAVIRKMKGDFELPTDDPENTIARKLYTPDQTEDEYLNALYENIIHIKEELADLLTVVVDNLYEEKDSE